MKLIHSIVGRHFHNGKFYMTLANGRTYQITRKTYFWLMSLEAD